MTVTKERACGECEKGIMQEALIDHIVERQDRSTIKIPKVKVNQCTECGRVAFPRTTSQYIERIIRDEDETISSEDLEIFRNNTGCTQDELSEILGLGDKTFHRWEKGSHYPSRSMGYYIRILTEYPAAFEWLKNRGWRNNRNFSRGKSLTVLSSKNSLKDLESLFATAEEVTKKFSALDYGKIKDIEATSKYNPTNVWNLVK